MSKYMKKVLVLMLAVVMSAGMFAGCGKKGSEDKKDDTKPTQEESKDKGEPKVITIGTHSQKTVDPSYRDPVTGKSIMKPDRLAGAERGVATLKKELNVDLKFYQYPGPVSEVILKSVLSNDPICDIAMLASGRGTVIPQNVLQILDEYEDKFKDVEYAWMFPEKIYGHHYLFNWDMEFIRGECLSYNISYLEKVEALKENGKTVLPTDLWKSGKWTWSAFEKYLENVSAYYANKKAPVRNEINIAAYGTDVKTPTINAIKSLGGSLYESSVIGIESDTTKKAVDYIDKLYSKKLITTLDSLAGTARRDAMKNGEVVFTDLPNWVMNVAGEGLASRGESMGVVPFPRPDELSKDDPKYQPLILCPGEAAIVKGISKEKTDLAVEVYRMYYHEIFLGRTGAKSVDEYFNSKEFGKSEASLHGIDVANEGYGQDMVDAYMAYNPTRKSNEAYTICPWSDQWDNLLRNSITGAEGSPKYEAAIAAEAPVFKDMMDTIMSNIGSDKIIDNIPPAITLVGKDIAIAKGTDATKIDWATYIKAADNVDGDIDIKNVTIDTSKIKFDTAGSYVKGLVATAKDKEGNEKKAEMNVVVYDPDNKTAPTLKIKEGYRTVKLNEDASKINWAKDFVDTATSAEGLDLKGYITADVSNLDITTAGKYNVTLTATDYAGNKVEEKIEVTVK